MPLINIKGQHHYFDDADVISFDEGLIGLPEMRRAVLVAISELEPFCWLASVENDGTRFIVVNPHEIFNGYSPFSDKGKRMLAIVRVSSDWAQTTVNLRAPIVIDPQTRTGTQLILSDSNYNFAERLVNN